jgi:hypothetical protein
MAALSDSEIWNPLFVAIGASALLFGGFRARAFVICLVLSLLLTSQLIGLLKSAVDRLIAWRLRRCGLTLARLSS